VGILFRINRLLRKVQNYVRFLFSQVNETDPANMITSLFGLLVHDPCGDLINEVPLHTRTCVEQG